MKIALLSPLTRPTEPDTRGSRPKIVYDLAKFLTEDGHDVTVFGPGDSKVPCRLINVVDQSVYLQPEAENPFYQHTAALTMLSKKIAEMANEFDVIHNHVYPEFLPLLVSSQISTPIITTPHLYMWKEYVEVLRQFGNTYFVPIANYQREQGVGINWLDTVYNGIAVEDFEYNATPDNYFLFFGRIKLSKINGQDVDPKGFLDAIEVCKRANAKLLIAGNVEDSKIYEEKIKPLLGETVEFVGPVSAAGPIGFEQKVDLYRRAKGYFFLSHWDEGCPLGPLEAMACGTPVIANRRSSLPEIVEDGKTGFICEENDLDRAVEAVESIDQIKREDCRKHIEEKFTSRIMVENYKKRYEEVLTRTKV